MMRALALIALPLALTGCASTGTGGSEPDYLYQTPYRETYASPLDVAAALVGNYPETTEAGPTMRLDLRPLESNPEHLVLVTTIEPVLDDSIAAEEWRAILSQGEDFRWRIEELGLRRKCSRGPDIGVWGANICP